MRLPSEKSNNAASDILLRVNVLATFLSFPFAVASDTFAVHESASVEIGLILIELAREALDLIVEIANR
jgi:hypothetical protein